MTRAQVAFLGVVALLAFGLAVVTGPMLLDPLFEEPGAGDDEVAIPIGEDLE